MGLWLLCANRLAALHLCLAQARVGRLYVTLPSVVPWLPVLVRRAFAFALRPLSLRCAPSLAFGVLWDSNWRALHRRIIRSALAAFACSSGRRLPAGF